MLNDEFKEIENFLKSQNTAEMQFIQKFDEQITNYIKENFNLYNEENIEENLLILQTTIEDSYTNFSSSMEESIKNFSISIVLIKNVLARIQNHPALNDNQQTLQKTLIGLLLQSLKKECEVNINHFKAFEEYIDTFIAPMEVDN